MSGLYYGAGLIALNKERKRIRKDGGTLLERNEWGRLMQERRV